MSMFDQGSIEGRVVVGAPAALGIMTVEFIPAAGETWEILSATVVHDDILANLATWWASVNDGAGAMVQVPLGQSAAPAAGEPMPLYSVYFPARLYTCYELPPVGPGAGFYWEVPLLATDGSIATLSMIGRVIRGKG
jgi:hypothetical protein